MKRSRSYKRNGKLFRYNFDRCLVEWIVKPTSEMIADNKEWQAKFHKDLWNVEDGYTIIETVGLRTENWKNKESRDEYLDAWCDDLDEESEYLAHQYQMYG